MAVDMNGRAQSLFAPGAPALVVSSPAALIIAANEAFCDHIGYVEAELLGQPLRRLQPQTVSGSLINALQAQQAGSGFSVHEVHLLRKSGAEERATIRASPLYCIETGALLGFSLLLCAFAPTITGPTTDSAVAYASPVMPAASVEGCRNVAPSVLRLLQIGGDEAWEAPARAHIEATATVRIDAAAAAAVAKRQAGHAADFGASDDDGSGDEDDGRNGLPLPPLPVNEATARAAWSVLCASVLQKSMFSNVLITRQPAPDELPSRARSASVRRMQVQDPGHYIWHVSPGLEQLLGKMADDLIGQDVSALSAPRTAPSSLPNQGCIPCGSSNSCDSGSSCNGSCGNGNDSTGTPDEGSQHGCIAADAVGSFASSSPLRELFEAVAAQRNCLIEVILPSESGAPLFCLAYVLPLACKGPRASSVMVGFLDVHRSLPYMQRHMEARGFGDCDLYTFVKFSLLNCLITDPSVRTADPLHRNPIVFASAGFGVMCGCAPHEVMHRNCRFLQSPSFVESKPGVDASFPQHEAVAHMSAALDARHESLTYLHNFRKDGSPFANLLFMTPILDRAGGGVLFWVGVQHPMGEPPSQAGQHGYAPVSVAQADLLAQLRSCGSALHAVQLQELYGSYTALAQRTALLIHSADGAATTMCRMCEHNVLTDSMQSHMQYCKIVTQCKTIAACSDTTLARQLVKLNAASNASAIFGSGSTPAALVVDLLRNYTTVLLAITASTTTLPILSTLPVELDRLVAAVVQPATASIWADIRAAGQRKVAALQHAYSWAVDVQATIVHMPTSDPLSQGQPPCLADFEMVKEIQRGSHATVWLVRKRQTKDVFAMKVIDKRSGRLNRLQTERKVLFLCSSPFVVKTFFAFEDPDALYLVMERLQQDCKHVLQVHGAMSEQHARPVLADLLLALEHLHACGIVHRDLKPENMLLDPAGRLKLADFGLSHIMARQSVRADDIAKDPSIVGTPFYMAPETIRGKARFFEAAADWWSFGVILYEFLLGFPPFQGAKVGEIYRAILSLTFAAPIANCAVSPESADLISRLLVADPRYRLLGAIAVMSHPFFAPIDFQRHALSAGHVGPPPMPAQPLSIPHSLHHSHHSLHSLAAAGGSLPARGLPSPYPPLPPYQRNGSGGSFHKSTLDQVVSADGVARSTVGSVGFESERSAASTTLVELATEHNESHTSHLDNLMGLNASSCGAGYERCERPSHGTLVTGIEPMQSGH